MCTSEDQTIISHAHGIVGKFRWLCPGAGWRSAMCLVRWSVAFSEWWDKTWKGEASAVMVTCTMRPCNSNNGNLCEPYDFALHGEGSSLWAVEHLIFLGFQLNTWSPHPFLFAKSWVSVIGKGTPMPHATLLPWEPFLTSEVRPCLWCESCRGHVLHCSLRGHRRVGREAPQTGVSAEGINLTGSEFLACLNRAFANVFRISSAPSWYFSLLRGKKATFQQLIAKMLITVFGKISFLFKKQFFFSNFCNFFQSILEWLKFLSPGWPSSETFHLHRHGTCGY